MINQAKLGDNVPTLRHVFDRYNKEKSVRHAVVSMDGFTLIELLVVICIIAILMALFFANWANLIDQKNRAICASNLRNISASIFAFAADNDGYMPYNNASSPWWRGLYPAFCSNMAVFSCPADNTGFSNPEDAYKGKQSYGPLGWDSGSSSGSAFNKRVSSFSNPGASVVLSEFFRRDRAVVGSHSWNYPGSISNATYEHHLKIKGAILFMDGHITYESQSDLQKKSKDDEIFVLFKGIPSR